MRLFIAVFPPADLQAAAYRAADPMRPGHDAVAWVRKENLHYTMRFLGDVDGAGAVRAATAMRDAAASRHKFGAALGGFGAFPSAKRARVLWIGMLQGAEPMRLLASALDASLVRHGFEPAEESFEPHLTVGRVRAPGDWTARLLDAPTVEARFQVDRMKLVSSVLAPGGSRYETVDEAVLAESAASTAARRP
jgi:2'-5' RNA ligase